MGNDVLRAAVYCRFSSDNQRDESIEAQMRAITKYANDNNLKIVKEYFDRAKSATTDKRPVFQQMIKDSKLRIFDVIIVHKLDRFSRDKYDSAMYKRQLRVNGVRLISVLEHIDGSPESIILESLLEGMAEYYSKNLAREVMKGMLENAHKGMHTGGTPPLGYDVKDKKLAINPFEAKAVEKIFKLFSLDFGYDYIINELNKCGYKTKKGNPFGKNSLHSILSNEKYAGIYVFNRAASKNAFGTRNNHESKQSDKVIRIEGGCPAIVDKEIFEKVQNKMLRNQKKAGLYKAKELYLLSGIIYCGECGYTMHGNTRLSGRNKAKYSTYRCGCKEQNHNCNNKEVNKVYIEEYVLRQLKKLVFNEKKVPSLVKRLNNHLAERTKEQSSEVLLLQDNLNKVNQKMANIIKAVEDGMPQSSFAERLSALDDEKYQLESRIDSIRNNINVPNVTEDDLMYAIKRVRGFISNNNLPECKQFILDFVEKVVVYRERVEVILSTGFNIVEGSVETVNVDKKALYKEGFKKSS